jgi:ATP-binding cassette, subfamily B, bacterial
MNVAWRSTAFEFHILKNIVPVMTIAREYGREAKVAIVSVLVLTTCASLSSVAAPYIFSRIVDRVVSRSDENQVVIAFICYAISIGIAFVLRDVAMYMAMMSAQNLSFITGTLFFERIVRKNLRFFVDYNSAEILSAQMQGQMALNNLIQFVLSMIAPSVSEIAFSLLVLGVTVNWEIAVIVMAYGIIFTAINFYANKRTSSNLRAASSAGQESAKFVGNALISMETLRYFGSDQWMIDRFYEKADDVRRHWRSFALKRIGYLWIIGAALTCQLLISFAFLLPRFNAGELSAGDVVLFNMLLLQLNQPFELAGRAIDDIVRAYAQLTPFLRMWLAPEEPETPKKGLSITGGKLTFANVGFHYENGRGIEHVSFTAERGKLTFLVGETGAGKSTLFKLALKSLNPEVGRISVDGTNLQDIARPDWFSKIGVVPQDIMLLNDTIRTNLILARPLDELRLRDATRKAAILDFIEALPEGFDTVVGERGLKLSGGERQRIGIARALYAQPQFLFLDEASSALDEATEKDIMLNVRKLSDEVTILAITHRNSVIQSTDDVVRLENGSVPKAWL